MKKPIERSFPFVEINQIAEMESTGFGRRHYRPVYVMHKWWARRLGSVFRAILLYSLADKSMLVWDSLNQEHLPTQWDGSTHRLWDYYAQDTRMRGMTVLDPMMGGGTTVVEALKLGCKVVAGDLNPVAWFVVKKEIEPVDTGLLTSALAKLDDELGPEIRKYYTTKCSACGGEAEASYYFWVKEVDCPDCGSRVPLMKDYFLASMRNGSDVVVCPKCGEVYETRTAKMPSTCPKCGLRFTPRKASNTDGRDYICKGPSCGKKRIIDTIKRKGRPGERLYAIEFYCHKCDKEKNPKLMSGRGYKTPDSSDHLLYRRAEEEFRKIEAELPIPDSDIPSGYETRRLSNHGYLKFRDMFNARQLLNLGVIYRWILGIEEENLKEFLILAFSNALKYNNMFCKYNGTRGFITDIFRTHSFSPSMTPVEANCYDISKGRGSFTGFVNLVIEGKEYCQEPFERVFVNGKPEQVMLQTPIRGELASNYDELKSKGNVLLNCGSSEQLDVPDKVVDAVITDPPYYGNVMYSELSNFFYVWLRLGLKQKYEHFRSKYAPWRAEVIESEAQKKTGTEFLEGLTRVLSESRRILKDDGLLTFTFHHKETEAWGAVLQAVLDSGFFVTSIYPVRSEMKASTHIYEMANIEYDMIIVCRKRQTAGLSKSWNSIESTISLTTREMIEALERNGQRPTQPDIFVMALGKCLEQYSMYYPNVTRRGEKVTALEAIESIREIVDAEISGGQFETLRSKLDDVTAMYLTYVIGKGRKIPYSTLDLLLKPRGFDIDSLSKHGLASMEGSYVVILDAAERKNFIEGMPKRSRVAIDRAHYLMALREEDRLASEWEEWTDEHSIEALDALGRILRSHSYSELASYLRKKLVQATLEK